VSDFEELKLVATQMRKNKDALCEQLTEFQELRKEISDLHHKATCDPSARRKLSRLEHVMKNGGEHLMDRLGGQVNKVEQHLKKINENLSKSSSVEPVLGGPASRGSKSRRKTHRAFV
jgi:hypothetical protein